MVIIEIVKGTRFSQTSRLGRNIWTKTLFVGYSQLPIVEKYKSLGYTKWQKVGKYTDIFSSQYLLMRVAKISSFRIGSRCKTKRDKNST